MSAETPSSTILELDNLQVFQGERLLLSGVSAKLAPGELVAIKGPSGSGKTTLLRTVAGLIGDGNGLRLDGCTPCELCWPNYRKQVLLVAQQPILMTGSLSKNLQHAFSYKHVDATYEPERARDLLDRLYLKDVALDSPALELSVGQQQRVCLVRSLLMRPRVLLLDEPTSALDADAAAQVEAVITEVARQDGTAALIVTHDALAVERWCDRLIDLEDFIDLDIIERVSA